MRLAGIGMIALGSIALLGFILMHTPKERVVTFNTKKVQALFIKKLAELKVTNEQAKNATLKFKAHLSKTLNEFSQSEHVVILEEHQVIAGGKDVTDKIIQNLSKWTGGSR